MREYGSVSIPQEAFIAALEDGGRRLSRKRLSIARGTMA